MAVYTTIQLRRDTSANWEAANPVLKIGEVGIDMTANRMKAGDGINPWKNRPYIDDLYGDMISSVVSLIAGGSMKDPVPNVSDLTTAYPSPQVGWTAYVISEGKFYTWTGSAWEPVTSSGFGGGGETLLVDALTSARTDAALTANQGRVLNEKVAAVDARVDLAGCMGMGYTVNERSAYDKPTKMTFEDGVVFTLTWNATQLTRVTASSGEVADYIYDGSGRLTGRTVTRP